MASLQVNESPTYNRKALSKYFVDHPSMKNILEFITILFITTSVVQAIALLPSLQGTDWYTGQKIQIQAVQNQSNDGSYYNAFLKRGNLVEQVLFEAPYQQYSTFIVPESFEGVRRATLYVVSEAQTSEDSMRVSIFNQYDYFQIYPQSQSEYTCEECNFF